MTELDGELPETVAEILDEFGADVTHKVVSGGTYNPATSSGGKTIGQPIARKAFPADYTLQTSGAAFASGLVREGDKQFFMAAYNVNPAPKAGDIIGFNGTDFNVLNVKVTYTGQLPALYELQGRS